MSPAGGLGFRPLVLISGLPVGGAESVTAQFLRHLMQTGRPVPVCTVTDRHDGPPAEMLARAGVPRHDLGARRLADPRALGRLVQLLRREEIDLVHAHGQDASILAAAASLLGRVKLVVTRHVLAEPDKTARQRMRAAMALAALGRADAIVAVSRAVAERLCEETAVSSDRVRVIFNGIDLSPFEVGPPPGARADVPGSPAVEEPEPVILVPSVLREGKGHELLLEALPEIRRRVPDVRVIFAGGGEREDALRRETRDRNVHDIVGFLGFRDDIPELLLAADVVVLPSRAEALPTVLLEAAAAGRPVVATRVGGTPEIVEDGRTGLLVPPDDAGALGRAVLALLQDGERADRFGRRARSVAEERFGIRRQVDRTLDLWREVAAAEETGRR